MSRNRKTMGAVLAALLASAAVTLPVRAQDNQPAPAEAAPAATAPAVPADPNTVVARIGDATVTEREVGMAQEAFSSELANVPENQRRSVLVDAVINMKLLSQGAREAGLDKGPEYQARLDFLTLQALRNIYVEHEVVQKLTDAELQDAYKTMVVAQHTPEQQVHARHILVDTKEAAEKIIADLNNGGSFEELAKQSKDPSGENGGDLGFFGAGQMVPPFEKAAFALEPGQYTKEPVQSEFGWHVIKVEEKRMSQPPSFDEVKEQLRSYVLRQKFETVLAGLRDKYPVEIVDPSALPPEPAAEDAPAMDDAPAMENAPMEEPAPGEEGTEEAPAEAPTEAPATESPTPAAPAN